MGKRYILALFGLASGLLVSSVPASAGRHCLYEGKIFHQGDVVCIRVDGQTRLARCEMMLNNATWNFFQDGCPTALMTPIRDHETSCPGATNALAAIEDTGSVPIHANVR
jgi:hypothetical protein